MRIKKQERSVASSGRTPHKFKLMRAVSNARKSLAGGVGLSLLVIACGGGGGSEGDSKPVVTTPVSDVDVAKQAAESSAVPLSILRKMNTDSLSSDATNERFIIKYRSGTSENQSVPAVQSRLDHLSRAFPARARHSRRLGIGADVVTTERKLNGLEAKAFMRAIASDPNVEYVEPDREMFVKMVPNDPEYSRQWGPKSNQVDPKTVGVRAEKAWDIARGSGVVMAVVDGGVTNHSDLSPNLLPGINLWGPTGATD